MGAEMERRQTSASPAAAAAAAGEWVPLRRHPVFSSAASSPTEHPTNLLAWDSSASRLYLWDARKSALHRLSLRFGDDPRDPDSIEAAAASKILFPDVRLQISVLDVAVNRAGTCVAICGANGLYVMYLYSRTASKDDGSATCRTVCVGSQLYVGEQSFVHILQVSWHSHSDTHLGILSSDSVFRLFDLSSDVDKAEQEFYLQPGERGRCHDAVSICPVAFSIGGEHLWERFSVFILFSDGSIYILCPVVPFGSFYSTVAVDELYKDAHNLGLNSSNSQAVNNSSLAISWLEAAFPEVADQAREGSKSLALRARSEMSLHACLLLQGPLRRVSHIGESEESTTHEVECKGRAVSFLLKSISKDSVIVIAWSSGQLQIDALADEIVPLWDTSTSPRVRVDSSGNIAGVAMICEPVLQDNPSTTFDLQASQNLDTVWLGIPPPLLRLAIVDLALPASGVTAGSFLMFSDPLFSEKMYCLHVGGVDLLSLHFLPFSSQSSGKDEYANAPSVVPVLTTGSDDSCPQFPLYGFVAVESSYGNSWIVGVTSSHECIVLETRGWDTTLALQLDGIQKPAGTSEELETETPNIISKELLLGPTSVFAPQGLSVVNPDSIEGHSTLHHYFKLFRENYVEYAHKVYIELKDHADHMKEIISDQHKRLSDAEHMLLQAEQKQSTLDERMKHVFQFHKKLEKRLQIFQDLPGAKKKPLSKAEHEFKHLLDVYKELELDALSSTISTLNARLRRSTQFTAAKSSVTKKQAPGTRRNHLLENQMTQLKSSMEKLSIVNSENSEKVKLVESALAVKGRRTCVGDGGFLQRRRVSSMRDYLKSI